MIEIEHHDGAIVARISGDVDMANISDIESEISLSVTSEELGFVLDLSGVTYLDSAGIRLLYHLDERATARQQKLVVVVPQGALINRTLEAGGALGSLRIVPILDEATDLVTRTT